MIPPDFFENDNAADLDIREANRRHDQERHMVTMDPNVPLRARNLTNVIGRKLTDKDIAKYERRGYYSAAFKEARREIWQKRALKRQAREAKRDGSFLVFPDGRKVYSPI